MTSALALVTGFWDPGILGRDPALRSPAEYLRLFERLHRTVPWPIVVWVDPVWADAVRALVTVDAPAPRLVRARPFASLPLAGAPGLEALRPFDNHDPRKDTLGFSIVMWSKPDLVVDAIRTDSFESSRWAWIDFGIAHVADLAGVDWGAIADTAPERVRLCTMRATTPAELEDLAEFYRANRGKVAGGFFTGSAAAMIDLGPRFHGEFARMRGTGRRIQEEQILAALAAREPDAFERWYADYAGLVANYVAIRRDLPTILDALTDCRARGLWAIGTDIARCLLEAMREEHVSLAPDQVARLLNEAFVCAYRHDRPLAERLARVLTSLHHHGNDAFRDALGPWRSVLETNLRFVGVELGSPSWTRAELGARPDRCCWRTCL